MVIATSGTGYGSEAALLLFIVLFSPIMALVGAIVGVTALRGSFNRRRFRLAMAMLALPYVIALIFGGPQTLGVIVEVTLDGSFFGRVWGLAPVTVAVLLAIGAVARRTSSVRT
jgi:ABC-type branched-subunit amino acid transport system permease subunit